MIPILAQIVQRYLPGYKIEELAAGEKIKAREFSYSAQVYLLMLGQLAHVFSLNELVDLSTIFSGELRRIRGIEAVKLTTFSHANRTRSPSVMQRFFWLVYGMFAREDPSFASPRHKGALAKFRMRGIYAADSTTIQLAYWCIKWAKHRQRKAAVKLHMVANVASMLPKFAVVGKACEHDSKREEELFASLLPGDVGILDRAYNNFPVLYRQALRGVFFVIREKAPTMYRVAKRAARGDLPPGVVSGLPNITPIFSRTWFVKMQSVPVCDSVAVSLRIACDMSRACRPTCASPMSPSISACGVSAATESTTTTCTAPDFASCSHIVSASSPELGCETTREPTSTPILLA